MLVTMVQVCGEIHDYWVLGLGGSSSRPSIPGVVSDEEPSIRFQQFQMLRKKNPATDLQRSNPKP